MQKGLKWFAPRKSSRCFHNQTRSSIVTFGGAINETIIIVSVFISYWGERVYKSISHLVAELNNTSRLCSNFWKEENSQQTRDAHQDCVNVCDADPTLIRKAEMHNTIALWISDATHTHLVPSERITISNTFDKYLHYLCCKNQSLGQTGLICYVGVGIYICIRLLYWHVQILQIHNIQIQWLMYPAH